MDLGSSIVLEAQVLTSVETSVHLVQMFAQVYCGNFLCFVFPGLCLWSTCGWVAGSLDDLLRSLFAGCLVPGIAFTLHCNSSVVFLFQLAQFQFLN